MLKINAVKIEVNTVNGPFTGEYFFSSGLNIIKGLNTAGKSTLFQSILYALGMEELLGGKNSKTMQSALRDTLEYPEGNFQEVTESRVFLEIENDETITLQRTITGTQSPKLVRVFYGGLLTPPKSQNVNFLDTWVHDSGGASNETRGFHYFLEKFLGWDIPNVVYSDGTYRKLYLQTIFPSFIVEQKSGWSEFLGTIPYFGIKNAESKSLEFILKLDVFENEQEKLHIKELKKDLAIRWTSKYENLQYLLRRGSAEISNISSIPEIITNTIPIELFLFENGVKKGINEMLQAWKEEYKTLESNFIPKTGQNIEKNTTKLKFKQNRLEELTLKWEISSQNLRIRKEKVEQYQKQLKEVREELRQNKDVKKIYSLGGEANISVANKKCPTCHQDIEDSLFPLNFNVQPMGIDENIKYIQAQENMILAFLKVENSELLSEEMQAMYLFNQLTDLRREIREIKRELIADERVPSEAEIERKVQLRNKIEFYTKFIAEVELYISEFLELSSEWKEILNREQKLPKTLLSNLDFDKLKSLEKKFKDLLSEFEYSSKDKSTISISKEIDKKFILPVFESEGLKYNIRFDSSGSDFIRAIWSFYCALFKLSFQYSTNHPKLLIFDEPAQQGVSHRGFNQMLKELADARRGQSFVFSSFNESEDFFKKAVQDIKSYNLIEIPKKSIIPEK